MKHAYNELAKAVNTHCIQIIHLPLIFFNTLVAFYFLPSCACTK
jgi:hypothetical protein